MIRKLVLFGAVFVISMGLYTGPLSTALADEGRHPPAHDRKKSDWGAHGIPTGLVTFSINQSERLGLSEEQVSKLKGIRNKFRKASAPVRADLQEAEEQYTDLLMSDKMDLMEIEVASQRIESLEHQLRMIFAEAISGGKTTLTPKQLKKVKELRMHSGYKKGHGD